MTHDVVVIGGTGVDTTAYVPALPLPYADTYAVPPVVDRIGNTGSGVALGCHALGLRVRIVDLVGDDPQGRLIREHFAARGVDAGWATAPQGTRRSVLLVGPDGRRTSLFDPRAEPGERLPRELYLDAVRDARHVHVSITDFSRHVYPDLAGRPAATVSTDLHDWDGENDHHRDFARSSGLVFLSAAALGDRREEVMRGILAMGRAETVVCTAGADGCHVLDSGGLRHFPAAPLPGPVADSNGAGDAFVSGFLYGRLHGRPVEECVRLGAMAGAHACTVVGTHEDPITEKALLDRV
ncbi:carbohydrate kinase family protein [Planomonospora parontospora]|uniref:carbohydrate kinase family protein n=1 Tax=Planomonospora parontospora TaxID=58119 RepID=UPI00166FA6DB|nr:PfkB family carbohydrate kinase [Planomonospora parontospora]GGL55849.1 ribokinase [Planomonospora parontospora subsp. antibiotica]GII19813.1 ribokinase [Planomonospora parontospora subsp. antibiotica]